MMNLEIKILAIILFLVLVISGAYLSYDYVYDRGYTAAEQKYVKQQNAKIEEVTTLVTSLITATGGYNASLTRDMSNISKKLNGKTLVEYREGKCQLTDDYKTIRTEAIERANKK